MNSFGSHVYARISHLKEFQTAIRHLDIKVDDDFRSLIVESLTALEMSDRELGDALSVSRPTINRWSNGKNLPYNGLRQAVFGWIDRQVSKKIRIGASAVTAVSQSARPYESIVYPIAAKGRER